MAEETVKKDEKIIISPPPPKPQIRHREPEFVEEETGHLDPTKEDPGMTDHYGSFPVWMLKLINAVTPDSLLTKEPSKKKYRV
jgi:hypothetical protein